MTNEQILKKAIEKAEKNGYRLPVNQPLKINPAQATYTIFRGTQNDIIFSHDFAKAFWVGDSLTGTCEHGDYQEMKVWEYHLRNMVLEKEPLKYLERFL